jgi:Ni/Fe-hydrogenase 1 B-type cytochrome subunit
VSGHGHYREAHPLIFVVTHYVNLIAMIALAFTGFYIHYPFFAWSMQMARSIHFIFMFILIINLTARIILSFWVKDALLLGSKETDTDIKNWLPQEENKHQFVETLKYYLFLRKEHVISGKYGSLQKIAYLATIPLTYLMAYTGFCIYTPAMQWGIWPFFQGGVDMVGGAMAMRMVHYFGMWVIILFTMVHAYLANIHGIAPTKIMFAWVETPAKEGH